MLTLIETCGKIKHVAERDKQNLAAKNIDN